MSDNNIEVVETAKKPVIGDGLRGVLSGTASGVAKLVVGHPFDLIKVRLQTEGKNGRFKGPIDCLVQTAKKEGLRGLYKGGTPPLFGWGVIDSTSVGVYIAMREYIRKLNPDAPLQFHQYLFAGAVAGWVSCAVVTPIEQVKVRLQIQYADPSTKIYSGPIDCVKKLVKNNGIFGLYKGFWGTVMFRTCMSVYYATYEVYKQWFSTTRLPTIAQNFISGGCAATSLWLVSFPFDVVKNKMMGQPDIPDRPYKTVRECFRKTWNAEGIKGFWRGFTPCMLRSFPTNGAAFVAIELVTKYLP